VDRRRLLASRHPHHAGRGLHHAAGERDLQVQGLADLEQQIGTEESAPLRQVEELRWMPSGRW